MMIFVALVVFLIGFLIGFKLSKTFKKIKMNSRLNAESEILKTEYENFLNYDGSVQQ